LHAGIEALHQARERFDTTTFDRTHFEITAAPSRFPASHR
jgi:hypothetical protein